MRTRRDLVILLLTPQSGPSFYHFLRFCFASFSLYDLDCVNLNFNHLARRGIFDNWVLLQFYVHYLECERLIWVEKCVQQLVTGGCGVMTHKLKDFIVLAARLVMVDLFFIRSETDSFSSKFQASNCDRKLKQETSFYMNF